MTLPSHPHPRPPLRLLLAALLLSQAAEAVEGTPPVPVWSANFEAEPAAPLPAGCRLEPVGGGRALAVSAPDPAQPHARLVFPLPLEPLRGAGLQVTARVRAEGVSAPPKPWNGIKVMLHSRSPEGDRWDQQNQPGGDFDWRRVGFTPRLPASTTHAELVLGLESVTGKAWFDDVAIIVLSPPRARPAAPPAGPAFTGHTEPRLRGAMISPNVTAADLETLASWGANHVRWQLLWGGFPHSPADNGDLTAYAKWLESALVHLDTLLPTCQRLGLMVLVDLHTPPGGRNAAAECPLFHEKRYQDFFLTAWEGIARRYRGHPAVWGYDLLNEPVEGLVGEGLLDWQGLAEAAARRIRAVDPDRALIVEPAPWGGPEALENLTPLAVPGVVYSVHLYHPHLFTHQGVHGNPTGVEYPGEVGGRRWDVEQLRRSLRPVVEFQRDHGAHMYIGEFSAIRWAPGDSAERWLRDAIGLFEEHRWDWAYHAFREWQGWSVEHCSDPAVTTPSPVPNARERLLRTMFARNRAVTPPSSP